ncbi:MAG: glycosyltransferase [Bacteroidota bacterium]
MWILWIEGLLGLLYLLMLMLLLRGWKRWPQNVPKSKLPQPPLSVIIAARNEAKNLRTFLPSICEQQYERFEVVLVLDRCEDNSLEVAEFLQKTYSNLRYIQIEELPDNWSGKKFALQRGIQSSKFDHLVFTDADCRAVSGWLDELGSTFAFGSEIILGLGMYRKGKGWLNRFIRFETWYAGLQYIGWAGWNLPYMAVGRNLAYKKSVYQEHAGFEAFKESLSGDDDLFVNQYGRLHRLGVVTNTRSRTYSEAKRSFKEWVSQKSRHLSASHAYSWGSRMRLGLFHFSHQWHYLIAIGCMLMGIGGWLPLSLLLGRIVISWLLLFRHICQFGHKDLAYTYLALDLFFFLYNLFIVPFGLIKKPSWTK